jgi:DNA-binding transcriptional MerR regulator
MPIVSDALLSIGQFSRLTGLSIGALRHYDELDLLRPAEVDRSTGYRRYRRDQIDTGRAVARLRDLEVPLDEIRGLLAVDDAGLQRRRIAEHQARIEARIIRLQRVLHVLGQLREGREAIVSESPSEAPELDAAGHRQLGVDLFNHVWTLIEKEDRTPEETDEMIHAAHASRYHWSKVGTRANLGRGEWQISRVYAVLGRAEPARWHAGRCLAYIEAAIAAGEADDWDLPAAHEGLARAAAIAGEMTEAIAWRDQARRELEAVTDPADREVIEGDLASLPI